MTNSKFDPLQPNRAKPATDGKYKKPSQGALSEAYRGVDEEGQARIRDLLFPLTYAEGNGLPRNIIWCPLASALSGRLYLDEDIEWLLNHCSSFMIETKEEGGPVYLLSSPTLASQLRQLTTRSTKEVQNIICQTLLGITPVLDGTSQKDWLAAHPYIRHHIIEHLAGTGSIDLLADDLFYLAVADPPKILKAMRILEMSPVSLSVYRLCQHYFKPNRYEENLSYFQLMAYQSGETTLGRALDSVPLRRRWSVRWAQRRSTALHHVLGRHGDGGRSISGKAWRGAHGVDVAELDGRNIAISCGYEGKIRMWDLDEAIPIGEPFIFKAAIWAQPMQVAFCHHANRRFMIALTALGDIYAWEWVGSFKQMDKIGHVLTLDVSDQMVASSGTNGSCIVACGVFLQMYWWDENGCSQTSIKGLISPSAAAFIKIGKAKEQVLIAAGSFEKMAAFHGDGDMLWDSETPWSTRTIGKRERVTCAGIYGSADGVAIFGTDHGNLIIRSLKNGEEVANPIKVHDGAVTCLTLMNQGEGSVLVTGGGDCVIKLWNLPDVSPIGRPLRGHNAAINALKVWPIFGVPRIISASGDATIRVWDIPLTSPGVTVAQTSEAVCAVASGNIENYEIIVTLTASGVVQFWDSDSGSAFDLAPFRLGRGIEESPVNRLALGLLSGQPMVAIAPTLHEIMIWNPVNGKSVAPVVQTTSNERRGPNVDRYLEQVCLGTVQGRLARVRHREDGSEGFAEVFDLESGRPVSTLIEANSPLNTLRLGVIKKEPVILSRNRYGLLFVASLSDGQILGEPFKAGDFAFPACVGELHGKPIVVLAACGRTELTVMSPATPAASLSIDVGTEVHGLALVGSSGLVVGTTKGLLKLDISPDAL